MTTPPTDELPPLEWLRAFEAAGRLGSFTAAAGETGLTQAAVSQRIKLLEERLGTRLFKRLPKGVELTVAGDAYLPHIADALARVRRGTADLFSRPRTRISIAATPSLIALWIAPRLVRLSASLPGTEISLVSIGRDADYEEPGHDYQIRFGAGAWDGYETVLLFAEVMVPVAAPAALSAVDDWRSLPAIALNGPRDGWREWASFTGEPPPGPAVLRFDSQVAALQAAAGGAGVALASLPLAAAMIDGGDLVRLPGSELAMPGGQFLCWAGSRAPRRQHEAVCRSLGAVI
ncbi:MAG: LysR family transcriptional regulator [Rhizobiaceae bacterium]